MDRVISLGRFYFDNQLFLHDNVKTKAVGIENAFKAHRNQLLPFDIKTFSRKPCREHRFVNGLEEAGTKFAMDMQPPLNRLASKYLDIIQFLRALRDLRVFV